MYFRILLLTVTIFATNLRAEEIILVADEWCPYNCNPDAENPGFMVEIADRALTAAGFKVRYEIVPWSRAIRHVREGTFHGIIGTGREETPDFIFPDLEQGQAAHTFYVKRGNLWQYSNLESLKSIQLGAIKDYSHGNLLKDYIEPNITSGQIQIVAGAKPLAQNIGKLRLGRIDALVEDRTVFQYYLHSTNTPDEFSEAGAASMEKVYVAFSPKNPQSANYAKLLSDATKNLRSTGELAQILKKYGVQDWR